MTDTLNVLILNGSPRVNGNTSIAFGKKEFGLPETETKVSTNFIR